MTPEQIKALHKFTAFILQEAYADGGGDVDHCTLVEMAHKLGLLTRMTATETNKDLWEEMDFVDEGDSFYLIPQWLRVKV